MLDELKFDKTECVVRVNAVSSGLMEEDFSEIFTAATLPQTIMVPKVNSVQEVEMVSALVAVDATYMSLVVRKTVFGVYDQV